MLFLEFIVGSSGRTFALTNDGQLYSPDLVTGSLTGEKVVQMASTGMRALALTLRGDVHHWFLERSPTVIAKEKFDYKKVTSVACNAYLSVALSEDGQVRSCIWFKGPYVDYVGENRNF